MPEDARSLALEVLAAVEGEGAYADAELGRRLGASGLGIADRGLATRLVYGTLAWRLRIDTVLEGLLERDPRRLDRWVHEILRMGLYQLLFLDRVPAYAVVDRAVEQTKRRVPAAAGLVNAVLRRAAREGGSPATPGDPIEALALAHSHPAWLVRLWLEEFGAERTASLLRADNLANPVVARVLDERARRLPGTTPARWAPEALVVECAPDPRDGLAAQSEASQLATLLVGAREGWQVLDACAAPGGKSAYLARLVGPSGRVVACDPAPGSRARIAKTAAECGVSNVDAHEAGVQELPLETGFDAALVDAPCSGLGTLRQHPEIRWRRKPEDLDRFARRQRAILEAAARQVRAGGFLVYATCTLAKVENDRVVQAFLASHPDFRMRADTEGVHPAVGSLLGPDGALRTYPDCHDTDGFFAVRMQRSAI